MQESDVQRPKVKSTLLKLDSNQEKAILLQQLKKLLSKNVGEESVREKIKVAIREVEKSNSESLLLEFKGKVESNHWKFPEHIKKS